jgi:hypothetical protein
LSLVCFVKKKRDLKGEHPFTPQVADEVEGCE